MTFTDEQLLSLAKRGLIAGPTDDTASFKKRIDALTSHKKISFRDFDIDWLEVTYSKKKLPFWQGGCTWIDEIGTPSLQLHPNFSKKSHHFGYKKEEVLDHEFIHVLRSAFDEPIYEEIFAYQTSQKWWRRHLGPLFRSNKEAFFLLLPIVLPILIIPVMSFFAIRHKRALTSLAKAAEHFPQKKLALFLTDREIRDFARQSPDQVRQYIKENPTLRWRQLRLLHSLP